MPARQGGASRAAVALARRDGFVEIRVADNGRGFPFASRRDLATLEQAAVGARTLKERARHLGGTLIVEPSDHGAANRNASARPGGELMPIPIAMPPAPSDAEPRRHVRPLPDTSLGSPAIGREHSLLDVGCSRC